MPPESAASQKDLRASREPLSEPAPLRRPLAFGWRLLCGAGVGLLLIAAFPPCHLPALLPLAIALLVGLLEGVTPRQASAIGLACGFVLFAGALPWVWGVFGSAAISLWTIAALFPALCCGLTVSLRRALPRIPAWLLFAVCWTAIEYFRSVPMPYSFGWLSLGYACADAPLVSSAALFGVYGLTFALTAVGAALFGLAARTPKSRTPKRPTRQATTRPSLPSLGLGVFVVGLLLLLAGGPFRSIAPPPAHPLPIRLVQANSEDDESLFRLSQRASPVHPDLILWPEYSFLSDPTHDAKLWQRLRTLPQKEHCYLLFGAKDQIVPNDEAAFRNTAYLLDPQGRIVGRHVKNHTVHFVRDGVPGKQAHALPTALGRLGVAICFDMDYPDVARRLTLEGAEVLLSPSDNPAEWGPLQHAQHRQLYQLRAVECGRWVATTDVAGNTFVVAPTGQIVQSVRTTDPVALDVRVGRLTGQTFYVRVGWLFGPFCLLALCVLCVWAALSTPALRSQHATNQNR